MKPLDREKKIIIGVIVLLYTVGGFCVSCRESRDRADVGSGNKREGGNHRADKIEERRHKDAAGEIGVELGDFRAIKDAIESNQTGEFGEIWKSLKMFSGTSAEKRELMESLVSQMCLAGKTEEAVNEILVSLGAGGLRAVLLQSVFRQSPMSIDALFELRRKLDSEGDRSAAGAGIVNSVVNSGDEKLRRVGEMAQLSKEEREFFLSGLTLRLESIARKTGNIADGLRLGLQIGAAIDSKSAGDASFVGSFLKGSSVKYPFEVWDLLCKSQVGNVDDSLTVFVAERMAMADPRRAMSAVLGGDGTQAGPVFSHWLKYDSKDASDWYQSNVDTLSSVSKSQISAAFAQNSLNQGNLEDAKKWLLAVDDAAQKNKLEGMVWTAEREVLRKQVDKDPVGTVNAMVSGKSQYPDYWLEEAVGTWVAKDFDKAQEWYQQNWKSLPKGKSQYVAAAFANQALTQGDAVTATQWAALIQDPKTKQRIQDGINKAGANAGK